MRRGLAFFIASAVGAKVTYGEKCLVAGVDYDTQPVDLTKYLGKWYEIQRDKSLPFEWGATCSTADYKIKDAAEGVITVDNRAKFWWPYHTTSGLAKCSANGRCRVSFSFHPEQDLDGPANYNVLSTDYESYSLVYSCENLSFAGLHAKAEAIWILSRTPTMSEDQKAQLRGWLQAQNVTAAYDWTKSAEETSQANCVYSGEEAAEDNGDGDEYEEERLASAFLY